MSSSHFNLDQLQKLIDHLPEFIDELRAQGYRIGLQDYVTPKSLLIKLYTLDVLPPTLPELSAWLSPVLATTPEEQRDFSSLFENWLRRLFPEVRVEVQPTPGPTSGSITTDISLTRNGWLSLLWHYRKKMAVTAVAVIIFATALLLILPRVGKNSNQQSANSSQTSDTNKNQNVNGNGQGSVGEQPTPAASPTRSPAPATTEVELQRFGYAYAVLKPVSPGGTSLIAESWYQRNFTSVLTVASIVPLVLFGAWWSWNAYQRRLQLERWKSKQKPRLDRIPVEGVRGKLFHGGTFRRLARELRRHRHLASNRLDIQRTVKATSRRGGFFTPVFGNTRALPEYLVLIDRIGYKDQQAQFENEIVTGLAENDVYIDRYYFQGDPQWCRQAGPETPHRSLHELVACHPDHYLVILSDVERLINPLTGQPYPWLKIFSHWHGRALLTPLPVLDWSYREWTLAHSDFTVAPASVKGIQYLIDSINAGSVSKKLPPDHSRPYPSLLLENPELWSQQHEPTSVNKLRAQLKRFLGDDGYYLLCACSVYPNLQWELTLYLAFQLLNEKRIDELIASLVRLPWLRHGFIPDWLRQLLIADLGPKLEVTVRKQLRTLLLTYLKNPQKPVPLTYASQIAESSAASHHTLIAKLLGQFNGWRNSRLLRCFIKRFPERSLLHDEVFLNFMSGSRLALAVPKRLRNFLLRGGRMELGLRVAPSLILALSAVAIVSLALLLWRPVGEIPAAVIPDERSTPDFKYTPIVGLTGTQVPFVVTNSVSDQYDFRGMALSVPPASGLTIASVSSERQQLSASLNIPAGPGKQVQLTLVDTNGNNLAYLPFDIGEVIALPNTREVRVDFAVLNSARGTVNQFSFKINPFRDIHTVIAHGRVGSVNPTVSFDLGRIDTGNYEINLDGPYEITSSAVENPTGKSPKWFTIPQGTGPFRITFYVTKIAPCRNAPPLRLSAPEITREGQTILSKVTIPGLDEANYALAPFEWQVTDESDKPRSFEQTSKQTTEISVDTAGMGGRTIDVRVSLDLTELGWPACTQQATETIVVLPNRVRGPVAGEPSGPRTSGSLSNPESPHGAVQAGTMTISEAKRLLATRYLYKGAVNEEDDAAFRAAVRDFQTAVGFAADGLLGPVTATRLQEPLDASGESITGFTFHYVGAAVKRMSGPRLPVRYGPRIIQMAPKSTSIK